MPLADRFTDYLEAWSTLGGAIGSILAVIVAGALLLHEMRSRNEERRDAEAGQARLVTVGVGSAAGINGKIPKVPFILANRSAEPISEVRLAIRLRGVPEPYEVSATAMGPATERDITWQLPEPIAYTRQEYYTEYFETVVRFTGSKGLQWERSNWNQPKRRLPFRKPSLGQRSRWWVNRRRQEVGRLFGPRWSALRSRWRRSAPEGE